VLSLASGHVYDLDDLIHVQGLKRSSDVLNVVRSEQIVAMLTIQTQIPHMMCNGSLSVKLK
jgi:hypothetical protein